MLRICVWSNLHPTAQCLCGRCAIQDDAMRRYRLDRGVSPHVPGSVDDWQNLPGIGLEAPWSKHSETGGLCPQLLSLASTTYQEQTFWNRYMPRTNNYSLHASPSNGNERPAPLRQRSDTGRRKKLPSNRSDNQRQGGQL